MTDSYDVKNAQKLASDTHDKTKCLQTLYTRDFVITEDILSICRKPMCFEVIMQKLFDAYSITMTYEQYVLVGSTVRSYLAWLKDTGRLTTQFENNMFLWKTI